MRDTKKNSLQSWSLADGFRKIRVGVLVSMVAALALSLLVACGGDDKVVDAEADTGIKTGGTLKVGMLSDHSTLDPQLLLGIPDIVTAQHTYDTLVFRNPDSTIQPGLAESWSANDDGSEWTFNLRKGVKFSNGKDFKAEDVIFTFTRLFALDSPLASVMAEPTAIVAVDDYTVRFEFGAPNAVLLDAVVKYHASIAPSNVDPARLVNETFGTGPFVMTELVVGETATFTKNADYWWDGHPYVDEVIFVFLPDPQSRAAALKAGSIDIIYDMNTSSVTTIEADPGTVVLQAASGSYMNLAMNTTEPPFDNVLVRRAVQAATDRSAILQTAQLGLGGIAYDHPVTPADPVFNEECKPPDYDPDLARDLLEQAGYTDGIDLTLHTSTGGAAMVEMATVLKESFLPAGINLDIVVMTEDGYWSEGWMVKPFTTVWWGGRPPFEAFSVVYQSEASWNESSWNNAEADALLVQAMAAADDASRKDVYGQLQCLVVEQAPRIIPVFRPVLLGVRNDVKGMEPMWDATLSLHRAWLDR